tara:strand:- start:118 stop:597 length:480 start_codon:yes stop_codon:yes gene_type:complete
MTRAKAKGNGGQPTKFTQAIADKLCELIMSGLSVHKICSMPSMPPRSTVNTWLTKDDKFSYQYANALQFRTHLKAEERHELIESAFTDIQNLAEGVNSNVWVTLVKEQVRAIEWDAERLAAKRYKPKETEHDKGEAQPLTINFNVSDPVSKVKTTNAKT